MDTLAVLRQSELKTQGHIMAAYLVIDAIVERLRSGRIYVNCGHGIVMSVSATNTKVTSGLIFQPGQAVRAEVAGNRILKLDPR